jgi:Dienelactone hydrolase and related enzymes
MNKIIGAICALLLSCPVWAQDVTGKWLGTLEVVGNKLRLVFNIKQEADKLSATMDSPDQGVKDIGCGDVVVKNDSLYIAVPMMQGGFKGKIADTKTIQGVLNQGPMAMPVVLAKQEEGSGLKRPQTPKPPYNYMSEDVVYTNADKSIQYGATITIPKGEGPFPALLLINGSGQQNRNSEIFEHQLFAVVADYLTNKGYMVLRVDDRGIGKTTGSLVGVTTEDFVKDAKVSLEYLRSRKEADKKKIGLYGHSEGGLIAEIIAAQDKQLDFVLLVAAPGMPVAEMMMEQNDAYLKSLGVPVATREAYINLYRRTIAAVPGDDYRLPLRMEAAVMDWKSAMPQQTVADVLAMANATSVEQLVSSSLQNFSTPWTKQFFKYDPGTYLERIEAKVLAINGAEDIQVIAASNLAAIDAKLDKKAKVHSVKSLNGLNHLLQTCKVCTVAEYKELEETMSPIALKTVGDWLDKEVKNK